jgi:hypothetical protein
MTDGQVAQRDSRPCGVASRDPYFASARSPPRSRHYTERFLQHLDLLTGSCLDTGAVDVHDDRARAGFKLARRN